MAIQLFALITRYTLIVQVSVYGTELNSGLFNSSRQKHSNKMNQDVCSQT